MQDQSLVKSGTDLPDDFKQESFVKKLEESDVFILKCPKCSKTHFRHAGYMHVVIPYVDPKEGNKLQEMEKPVKVCVSCKTSIIFNEGKVIDVTKHIDLEAWEKTEKEAYKATGPGGQC